MDVMEAIFKYFNIFTAMSMIFKISTPGSFDVHCTRENLSWKTYSRKSWIVYIFYPEIEFSCHFDICRFSFSTFAVIFRKRRNVWNIYTKWKENLDLWQRLVANGFFSKSSIYIAHFCMRILQAYIYRSIERRISIRFQ